LNLFLPVFHPGSLSPCCGIVLKAQGFMRGKGLLQTLVLRLRTKDWIRNKILWNSWSELVPKFEKGVASFFLRP